VVATALGAAVGNAKEFINGRPLAAWLGLEPIRITSICYISTHDTEQEATETGAGE
jgi:hypothetical protein